MCNTNLSFHSSTSVVVPGNRESHKCDTISQKWQPPALITGSDGSVRHTGGTSPDTIQGITGTTQITPLRAPFANSGRILVSHSGNHMSLFSGKPQNAVRLVGIMAIRAGIRVSLGLFQWQKSP